MSAPVVPLARRADRIDRRFDAFHAENPEVMTRLVQLTRQAMEAGATRVGMKMLFEVVRWDHTIATGGKPFKLDNNYTSRFARRIMDENPDLEGIFELRELRPPVPDSLMAAA